jgi:hypothetical protein
MTSETETREAGQTLRVSLWSILGLGAAFALVALGAAGTRASLSVAAGAGLGAVNLWALGRIVRGLLAPGGPVGSWVALGVIKLGLVLGALYVLIRNGFADILPLALGLATLPLGIVIAQIVSTRLLRGPS